MEDFNSVHLQELPNVSNITYDEELVKEMDLVKEICSISLFLRDRENLRVRLPLNSITIIGNDTENIRKYKDIIADEINVKNVKFETNFDNYAIFSIEVNLKKIGPKYGSKLNDIMKCVKENKYKELENGKVEIDGNILEKDEFEIKLKLKDKDAKNIMPLSNNKILIALDFNITEDLEMEGIARDLVRIIQQKRKDTNLDISDRIKLSFKIDDKIILKAIEKNKEYIKIQTLSKELEIVSNINETFSFGEEFNKSFIKIGFSIIK